MLPQRVGESAATMLMPQNMAHSARDVAIREKKRAAWSMICENAAWKTRAAKLHPQQLDAVRHILDPDKPNHYTIGQGGTGKSHVIHFVIDAMTAVGGRVQPVCSFGQAAGRIGGKTIHTAFNIAVSSMEIPPGCSGDTLEEYFGNLTRYQLGKKIESIVAKNRSDQKRGHLKMMQDVDLFIFDEVMSISPALFVVVYAVIHHLGLAAHIASFGDPMQITAPEKNTIAIGELEFKKMLYIFETPVWPLLQPTVSILTKDCNHRFGEGLTQKIAAALVDEDYTRPLDDEGLLLQEFIDSRVVSDVKNLPDGTRALSFTHEGNMIINREMMLREKAKRPHECVDFKTIAIVDSKPARVVSDWHQEKIKQRPDMTLAPGMPVHFVVNSAPRGYYNGTPGEVVYIEDVGTGDYAVTVVLTGEGENGRTVKVGMEMSFANDYGEAIMSLPFVLSYCRVVSAAQGCQYDGDITGHIYGTPFASGLGAMAIMRFSDASRLTFSISIPVETLLLDPKARIFYELAADAGPDAPCLYSAEIAAAKNIAMGMSARGKIVSDTESRKRKSDDDDDDGDCIGETVTKTRRAQAPPKRSTVVPMQIDLCDDEDDEFSNWPTDITDAIMASIDSTSLSQPPAPSVPPPTVPCRVFIH